VVDSIEQIFLKLGDNQPLGITLFGSNDPDQLVKECVRQLEEPLSNPFREEEFLVQSRGMGTWLQLKIAEKRGIFAHARFRFQEEAIWMILRGFSCLYAFNNYNPKCSYSALHYYGQRPF